MLTKVKNKKNTKRGKRKQKSSVTREEKGYDEWVDISLDLEQNLAGNPTRIIPILSISGSQGRDIILKT